MSVDLLGDRQEPRIAVDGVLDAVVADHLWAVCDRLIAAEPDHLDLDLSSITGISSEGIQVLGDCLRAGQRLADGIRVIVASPASRRALLDSMQTV
jgi:ABC-type transporter Mla MlaB component